MLNIVCDEAYRGFADQKYGGVIALRQTCGGNCVGIVLTVNDDYGFEFTDANAFFQQVGQFKRSIVAVLTVDTDDFLGIFGAIVFNDFSNRKSKTEKQAENQCTANQKSSRFLLHLFDRLDKQHVCLHLLNDDIIRAQQ